MKSTIYYHLFLLVVSVAVIAFTIALRLESPAVNGILVFASIFSVFTITVSISILRHELAIYMRNVK